MSSDTGVSLGRDAVRPLGLRVLMVDDAPLHRAALAAILQTRRDLQSFDAATDGPEALDKLRTNPYDVVLLDSNLPDHLLVELIHRLKGGQRAVPPIVLLTAREERAVSACTGGTTEDPFGPSARRRINGALDIATRGAAVEPTIHRRSEMPHLDSPLGRSSRIGIKSDGKILFVDLREIVSVEAQGNCVVVRTENSSHMLRESISLVAKRLKGYGFVRIHRSTLVNKSFVQEIKPGPTRQYGLQVKGGREYLVSRTYKHNLKSLALVWIGADSFDDVRDEGEDAGLA